jgi:hypothetical protein
MTDFNPIERLQAAGVLQPPPANHMAEGHKAMAAREVLGTLSPDEVDLLTSIKQRMDTKADELAEVESHAEITGGFLW